MNDRWQSGCPLGRFIRKNPSAYNRQGKERYLQKRTPWKSVIIATWVILETTKSIVTRLRERERERSDGTHQWIGSKSIGKHHSFAVHLEVVVVPVQLRRSVLAEARMVDRGGASRLARRLSFNSWSPTYLLIGSTMPCECLPRPSPSFQPNFSNKR